MKTIRSFAMFLLALTLVACQGQKEKKAEKETTSNEKGFTGWTIEKRFEDGSVKKKSQVVNGKRHGVSYEYYASGKLFIEQHYKTGKRDSLYKKYYRDGKTVYIETMFKEGRKNGLRRKFSRSGQLTAEIPYKQNLLGLGTKEYKSEKTLYTQPTIKTQAATAGTKVRITAKLSNGKKKVEFFVGSLIEGKWMHKNLKAMKMDGAGVGSILVSPEEAKRGVTIVGKYTTSRANPVLLTTKLKK